MVVAARLTAAVKDIHPEASRLYLSGGNPSIHSYKSQLLVTHANSKNAIYRSSS